MNALFIWKLYFNLLCRYVEVVENVMFSVYFNSHSLNTVLPFEKKGVMCNLINFTQIQSAARVPTQSLHLTKTNDKKRI